MQTESPAHSPEILPRPAFRTIGFLVFVREDLVEVGRAVLRSRAAAIREGKSPGPGFRRVPSFSCTQPTAYRMEIANSPKATDFVFSHHITRNAPSGAIEASYPGAVLAALLHVLDVFRQLGDGFHHLHDEVPVLLPR